MILRQYKLDLLARFTDIKSVNLKIGQDQITKELGCSSSILQRYAHDVNMLSPYRIPSDSHKGRQNISNTNIDDNSNREYDLKTTSNVLKNTSKDLLQIKKANCKKDPCMRLLKLAVNI